jgi:hypothetical protein
MGSDVQGIDNAVVVPDDKYWIITHRVGEFEMAGQDYFNQYNNRMVDLNSYLYPAGTRIWLEQEGGAAWHFIVTEHNLATNTTLSSTNVELPNKIKLFPNPTTSEVTLNSDKQYDIEVFDMLGNKVMEFTGNSINMSNLSDAMYIVKAFDKIEKTSVSYKVIKN